MSWVTPMPRLDGLLRLAAARFVAGVAWWFACSPSLLLSLASQGLGRWDVVGLAMSVMALCVLVCSAGATWRISDALARLLAPAPMVTNLSRASDDSALLPRRHTQRRSLVESPAPRRLAIASRALHAAPDWATELARELLLEPLSGWGVVRRPAITRVMPSSCGSLVRAAIESLPRPDPRVGNESLVLVDVQVEPPVAAVASRSYGVDTASNELIRLRRLIHTSIDVSAIPMVLRGLVGGETSLQLTEEVVLAPAGAGLVSRVSNANFRWLVEYEARLSMEPIGVDGGQTLLRFEAQARPVSLVLGSAVRMRCESPTAW